MIPGGFKSRFWTFFRVENPVWQSLKPSISVSTIFSVIILGKRSGRERPTACHFTSNLELKLLSVYFCMGQSLSF